MIIVENHGTCERRYSDRGVKIRLIETNTIWNDVVTAIPCQFTFEETDIPVDIPDPPDDFSEATQYILQTNLLEVPEPDPEDDYFNEHEPEPDYFNA